MSKRRFRYHHLRQDELEHELFALCLRLRRSGPMSGDAVWTPAGSAVAGTRGERCAARRCYLTSRDRADTDFAHVLAADDRVRALMGTLNETASLLQRFALS